MLLNQCRIKPEAGFPFLVICCSSSTTGEDEMMLRLLLIGLINIYVKIFNGDGRCFMSTTTSINRAQSDMMTIVLIIFCIFIKCWAVKWRRIVEIRRGNRYVSDFGNVLEPVIYWPDRFFRHFLLVKTFCFFVCVLMVRLCPQETKLIILFWKWLVFTR